MFRSRFTRFSDKIGVPFPAPCRMGSKRAARRGRPVGPFEARTKMMNVRTHPFGLLVGLAGVLPGRGAWAQHDAAITPELYAVVCDVAVDALPRPLQTFYGSHREALHQIASSMDPAAKLDGAPQLLLARRSAPASHYVWLDADVPPDGDTEARLAAAIAFRRAHTHHDVEAEQHRVDRNGTLPWALDETFHMLVEAFRTGDNAALISTTGVLIHLAVDAATPAQVTAWGSGERHRRGQARFAQAAAEHTSRLVHEVRVSPLRFRVASDAWKEVFDVLIATHRAAVVDFAPRLGREDKSGKEQQTGDAERLDFLGENDVWPGLLEDRLEAGAVLAARLIGTAWTHADLPQLPTSTEPTAATGVNGGAPPSKADAKPDAERSGPLVGTRTSKVFHRQGCPHAQRISPANVVSFSTPEEAIRAGRKACRACNPTGAQPPP